MSDEQTVWKGPSSQVVHLGTYILCVLFCWLIVPIFIGLWKWIQNRCRVYEVTTERVRISTGVFSRKSDDLELYRVKDITLLEPFWLRLFGLGNIVITTNDVSTPTLTLEAIPKALTLRDELRTHVEECRERKKVRLAELE
jgi:uncharacterized membrane protein YdbT with pleckstrin-like domain